MNAMPRRHHWSGLVLALIGTLSTAVAQAGDPASLLPPNLQVPAGVELTLVTVVDRSLTRAPTVGPGDRYVAVAGYDASAWGKRVARELATRHALTIVTQWPIQTLGVHCVVYAISDGRAVDTVAQELRRDAVVSSVYPMNAFHTMATESYRPLQRTVVDMRLDAAHRFATGRNIAIGMVDTAVDVSHADLADQIVEQRDLVTDSTSGVFSEAHGTAVAGVIVAHGRGDQGIVGVAPDAHLTALRACWPSAADAIDATCNTLTLAKALDTAIRLKVRVLNLSLSGPRDALLETLVRAALDRGMIVVAATPPVDNEDAAFPTGVAGVLRIAVAGASSRSTAVVVAPGTDVFTTFPHGRYGYMSGSSIAAAHVSGVIALLLQVAPQLSAAAVTALLQAAPVEVASNATPTLDACAAIARAAPGIQCPVPEPAMHEGQAAPPTLSTRS